MRRILLIVGVFSGAVLTGLLLAALLLKQECPDCSGTALHHRENPSLCIDGPAILDCPRCGDSGRVTLLHGKIGAVSDPLVASLMRHSNRESWRHSSVGDTLAARLKESPLRRASGGDWAAPSGGFGRSRFISDLGRGYILVIYAVKDAIKGGGSLLVHLLDVQGKPLDVLSVTSYEGASLPEATFVIPFESGGPCVRITLLNWRGRSTRSVEIDHAAKLWKETPEEPREKLEQLEWRIQLREGKLRVIDSGGKSIPE